jgi:hypothetical protein
VCSNRTPDVATHNRNDTDASSTRAWPVLRQTVAAFDEAMRALGEPYATMAALRLHAAAAGGRTVRRAATTVWESLAIDASVAESIFHRVAAARGRRRDRTPGIHGDVDAVSI